MSEALSTRDLKSDIDAGGLVSVVITCYNQARFLPRAIASVLKQTYVNFELIVVDDGSTDQTSQVALAESRVRYVRQENLGLSAARNHGIREGRGQYVVFLDADDLLLPEALASGMEALRSCPDCAFVFGDYHYLAEDGGELPSPRPLPAGLPDYTALLMGNFIGMHATVMYRREIFDVIGTFSSELRACEDYDLYLRIARVRRFQHYPVYVAEYRVHDENMSHDLGLMLRNAIQVLHAQREYIRSDPKSRSAYRIGLRSFAGSYAGRLAHQARKQLFLPHQRARALEGFLLLCRYYPLGFLRICATFVTNRFAPSGSR